MPKQKCENSASDDSESYDSDASILVYHPILTYAELSDDAVEDERRKSSGSNDEAAEIEEAENFQTPHSSRPRRRCVKATIKQEISKRVKKVSSNASSNPPIPLKKRITYRTVVKAAYEHEIHQVLLPQFHYSVTFPNRTAYKRWKNPLPFNNCILPNFLPIHYDAALEKFRSLRNGTEIPHASTLILGDSILASCNFEEKLDSTVSIMITFPNKAEDFTDSFTKKIIDCANDFTFKNIVIAFGTEFILYDPDLKAAVDAARNFIISILNTFNKYFESKPYVRIILLTLPQVNSNSSTIDFSYDFSYFNKQMRKFVHKYRDEIKEKQNIDFCLFDWEKKSIMFKKSNVEHVSRRYQILLNHLSKYTSVTDY
uniref:Uncharacterized protein n=1 Tax=Panagrolaimus sp. PS1159 TaxID=55785 RepID=A0AC35F920_9BILA